MGGLLLLLLCYAPSPLCAACPASTPSSMDFLSLSEHRLWTSCSPCCASKVFCLPYRPRPGSRAPSFQHQRSTSSHPRRSEPEGQEGRPLNGAVNSSFDGARPSGSRSDTPPQGQAGKDEPWSHSLDRQHMAAAGPDRHSRGVPGYVRYAEPGHRYGPPEAYWFNEMNPYWEDELWQSEYQPSDYRPRQGDYWHESGDGQDDTAQDAEEQQFHTSKH